jgi:hypothetical protein
MKWITHLIILLSVCSGFLRASPSYDIAISRLHEDPSSANVIELGQVLISIAYYNSPPEINPYYSKIQKVLLSVPGHARFFASEIKSQQKEVAHHSTIPGPRGTYDFNRGHYFLPLPQNLWVKRHNTRRQNICDDERQW